MNTEVTKCVHNIILWHSLTLLFNYLKKHKTYGKNCTGNAICASLFSATSVQNTFASNTSLTSYAQDHRDMQGDLHVRCLLFSLVLIKTETGMCWQGLVKYPYVKFNKNLLAVLQLLQVYRLGRDTPKLYYNSEAL
jgi:hypothetical protein